MGRSRAYRWAKGVSLVLAVNVYSAEQIEQLYWANWVVEEQTRRGM